ncbi:mCG146968 [Mus musculus]|nr:mCG146968 [Mus musculus]
MPRDLSKETLGTLWAPTRVLDLWKKIRSALLFWRRRNISFFFSFLFFFFFFFVCVCVCVCD